MQAVSAAAPDDGPVTQQPASPYDNKKRQRQVERSRIHRVLLWLERIAWVVLVTWCALNSVVQWQRDVVHELVDANNLRVYTRGQELLRNVTAGIGVGNTHAKRIGNKKKKKGAATISPYGSSVAAGVYLNTRNESYILGLDAPPSMADVMLEFSGALNAASHGLLGSNVTRTRIDRMGALVDTLHTRLLEEQEKEFAEREAEIGPMSFEDRHIAKLRLRANGGRAQSLRSATQPMIAAVGADEGANDAMKMSKSKKKASVYERRYPRDVLLTDRRYIIGDQMRRPRPTADATSGVGGAEPASLPPEDAEQLRTTSDLCGVTTYFNPAKYKNKLDNFKLFYERVGKGQGLYILAVELAFTSRVDDTEDLFELQAGRDCDDVLHLTTSPSNSLWQKERMMNLGIERLPERCTKVAWIDADSFFSNENWVTETSKLLEELVVVQPYAFLVRLPPGSDWIDPAAINVTTTATNRAEDVVAVNQLYRGAGFVRVTHGRNAQKRYLLEREEEYIGHTGIAWCARRDFLMVRYASNCASAGVIRPLI